MGIGEVLKTPLLRHDDGVFEGVPSTLRFLSRPLSARKSSGGFLKVQRNVAEDRQNGHAGSATIMASDGNGPTHGHAIGTACGPRRRASPTASPQKGSLNGRKSTSCVQADRG